MSPSLPPHFVLTLFACALAAFAPTPAHALVLTFDPVNLNFERINQSYGDRVTMTPQDGFFYGTDGGFTPNIEVDYGVLPEALPSLWMTGYGDLVNVLYEDQDGYGQLEVTLTADPSWNAVLHGFDMAAYSAVGPINSVSVRDGDGTILFTESDIQIVATGHNAFVFDPPLQGQVLVIAFDSGNLGTTSDNIAIDNIEFSQLAVLPVEATTWGGIKALYR